MGSLMGMAGRLISSFGLLRDPKKGCGGVSLFAPILGYSSARGYRYDIPKTGGAGQKKFSLMEFLKETAAGGITGGVVSAGFYGAGYGIETLKDGVRDGKRIEEMPSGRPQSYTHDLSNVTGKAEKVRQRAIEVVIKEDFSDLKLSYKPKYSPFIRTGIAIKNTGTQIGKNMFVSRNELRDTIIHEELHHRWWRRGIIDHHPVGTEKEKL